jgi:hypothetical protein
MTFTTTGRADIPRECFGFNLRKRLLLQKGFRASGIQLNNEIKQPKTQAWKQLESGLCEAHTE